MYTPELFYGIIIESLSPINESNAYARVHACVLDIFLMNNIKLLSPSLTPYSHFLPFLRHYIRAGAHTSVGGYVYRRMWVDVDVGL